MNTGQQCGSPIDRAERLTGELKTAVSDLEASLTLASQHDLRTMEARLTHEIRALGIDEADLLALNGLLVRSRKITARLSALDALTTPKENER